MKTIILVLLLPLSSCFYSDNEKQIEELTLDYLQSEQTNDWSSTYNLRSSEFRESIRESEYIKINEKDYAGLRLIDFDVEKIESSEEKVNVLVKRIFHIKSSANLLKSLESILPEEIPKNGVEFESKDTFVWKKVGSDWYCENAGSNIVSTLNTKIY